MSKENGGPAFPRPYSNDTFNDENCLAQSGMSLRDYFATAALQGLLANPGGPVQQNPMSGWSFCNCDPADIAREAYGLADAMLAEREKGDTA